MRERNSRIIISPQLWPPNSTDLNSVNYVAEIWVQLLVYDFLLCCSLLLLPLSVTVISADFSDLVTSVTFVMLYIVTLYDCGMNVYCNPAYGCQTTINVYVMCVFLWCTFEKLID